MLAFGKTVFDLFHVPWRVLEYGRGWLFEGGDYAGAVFLVLTLTMGGLMAFAAGRALARTWRPLWQAFAYMLPLTAMIRFLHFALFEENLTSLVMFTVTFVIVGLFASWGYRSTRAGQMVRQYPFAFRRAGPFNWQNSA